MLEDLNTYDWEEAFKYADPEAVLQDSVNTDPFTRDDVAKIHGLVEGENDGPSWIVWGELKDGRWFSLSAGCDYTGWG